MMMEKEILIGKTLDELKDVAARVGLKSFAAKQLSEWLYQKRVTDFSQMTNLPLKAREQLAEQFSLGLSQPVQVQESKDGTKKYLFKTDAGHFIESVYIPDEERATLCVSSQVGCRMGCVFCATGKQGFQVHLAAHEILNQIQSLPEREQLTNIVYMGMGDPMDNMDAVFRSLEVLTSDWGYAWSPRRITVSTIGVMPGLQRFIIENKCHLAVSLHSPFDDERRSLMPMQKAFPIKDVIDEIRKVDFGLQRRVSFEYIMFKGVNDSRAHADALFKLLSGLRCRVNLIKFHSIPDASLQGCNRATMEQFRDWLNDKGLTTTIRQSRGEDILAACGLLSTNEKNKQH